MKRVLITRAPHQASALADSLRALGIEPVLIPAIEIAPPASLCALDAALACLPAYHWIVFTSANAVDAFFPRLATDRVAANRVAQGFSPLSPPANRVAQGFSPLSPPTDRVAQGFSLGSHSVPEVEGALAPARSPLPANCLTAAIGAATARALQPFGIQPALIPPQAVAESLAAALIPFAKQPDGTPTRFLIPRAEAARDHLHDALTAAGAHVTLATVYRNVIPAGSVAAIRELFRAPAAYPDAITFTSGSAVTNLLALLEESGLALPPDVLRISIGPITSAILRDHNLPPHAEAAEATIPTLVEKVSEALFHLNK